MIARSDLNPEIFIPYTSTRSRISVNAVQFEEEWQDKKPTLDSLRELHGKEYDGLSGRLTYYTNDFPDPTTGSAHLQQA